MISILVILDRSGSMQDAKADHEGGLRSFVQDQKDLAGDVRFTLVQFDTHNPCEIMYDGVPIGEVGEIHLVPRGGTPLLDAMGLAISHVETKQKTAPAEMTVVMVVTDGEENSSHEWTKDRLKERVKALENQAWKFLFLGANIDAFSEAGTVGVAAMAAINFANTPKGVASTYTSAASNVLRGRRAVYSGVSGQSVSSSSMMDWSDEQRVGAMGFDPPQSVDVINVTDPTTNVVTSTASSSGDSSKEQE